jgi:hypothetical protein
MDAHLTNAVTNGLHALCLLIYFLAAKRAANAGNERFTTPIIGFFLLTFILKVMGVFVHYSPGGAGVGEVWVGIGIGMAILSILILHALRFSSTQIMAGACFAVACTAIFISRHNFLFLAIQIVGINSAAALYCRGKLRLGFLGVAVSTVVWIVAREGTKAIIGGELPTVYRYDNDLFHFMLIASTFIIYKAIAKGDGLPEACRGSPAVEDVETAPGVG